MNKIKVKLSPDFSESGLCSTVSWHRLLPHIKKEIGEHKNEEITGLIIDENGVQVQLKIKDGK